MILISIHSLVNTKLIYRLTLSLSQQVMPRSLKLITIGKNIPFNIYNEGSLIEPNIISTHLVGQVPVPDESYNLLFCYFYLVEFFHPIQELSRSFHL